MCQPVAEVDLFVEHVEVGVEAAGFLERVASDKQDGADEKLCVTPRAVIEPCSVKRVQRARARCEPAEEEVLGNEPPWRREPTHRALQRSVRVRQSWPYDRDLLIGVEALEELCDCTLGRPRVRIEQQETVAA